MYALVNVIVASTILLAVFLTSDDSAHSQGSYWLNYGLVVLMALPGYIYFGIFRKEKRHLKVRNALLVPRYGWSICL